MAAWQERHAPDDRVQRADLRGLGQHVQRLRATAAAPQEAQRALHQSRAQVDAALRTQGTSTRLQITDTISLVSRRVLLASRKVLARTRIRVHWFTSRGKVLSVL